MQEVSEMLKDVNGRFAVHIFCCIFAAMKRLKDTIDTYAIDADIRNIDSLVSVLDSCIVFLM